MSQHSLTVRSFIALGFLSLSTEFHLLLQTLPEDEATKITDGQDKEAFESRLSNMNEEDAVIFYRRVSEILPENIEIDDYITVNSDLPQPVTSASETDSDEEKEPETTFYRPKNFGEFLGLFVLGISDPLREKVTIKNEEGKDVRIDRPVPVSLAQVIEQRKLLKEVAGGLNGLNNCLVVMVQATDDNGNYLADMVPASLLSQESKEILLSRETSDAPRVFDILAEAHMTRWSWGYLNDVATASRVVAKINEDMATYNLTVEGLPPAINKLYTFANSVTSRMDFQSKSKGSGPSAAERARKARISEQSKALYNETHGGKKGK
jgi:hypothetical protein